MFLDVYFRTKLAISDMLDLFLSPTGSESTLGKFVMNTLTLAPGIGGLRCLGWSLGLPKKSQKSDSTYK